GEASRQLLIAKRVQIELDTQIKHGERIPIADATAAVNQLFTSLRGVVKANLPLEAANQVFDQMRQVAKWLREQADQVDTTAMSNNGKERLELEYLAHYAPLAGVCRETLAKAVRRRQVTPTAVSGLTRQR